MGRAVVLVSGGAAVTPYTTPEAAAAQGLEAGNTLTAIRRHLLDAGLTVFTAPASLGGEPVVRDAGWQGFDQVPVVLPADVTVNSVGTIDDGGTRLHAFLLWLAGEYRLDEVDIVAHSMGGLFSRAAIRDGRDGGGPAVRRLITLGTPWTGSLLGDYIAGDVSLDDAHGDPIAEKLTATLIRLVNQHGRVVEREVLSKNVETGKNGKASVSLKADDLQEGNHLIRVAGTDRFGNPIVADRAVHISGKQDETKLRILAERQRYKAGEEASVNVHSRGRAGTALLTWEADRILSYRVVPLGDGDNAVAWTVDGAQFPNFTLNVARMWEDQFDQARLDVAVERDLRVTVSPVKSVVAPGDPIELDVTTVDQLGKPVSAELSIA
ncbi:MAG: alpha/beta hydrolase, partial [Microbacterium sp.]|nr:alpha/beta hydrolase [Microbacterium sp.]